MCNWNVTGKIKQTVFQHKLSIAINGDFSVITEAATRAEAEHKIRIIMENKKFQITEIKAELY